MGLSSLQRADAVTEDLIYTVRVFCKSLIANLLYVAGRLPTVQVVMTPWLVLIVNYVRFAQTLMS